MAAAGRAAIFGHFLVVVELLLLLLLLLLVATRDRAWRPQRRIGKNIADLRARGRRKRDCRGGHQGRNTSQGNGSKHLAALKGESGSRHSTILSAARVPTG
ncbi:hypothetical protein ABIE49_000350 [Bradyrhizobium sp. OAE829]